MCAVALLRIRELGGELGATLPEREKEREGKARVREEARERVCRKSMQDAPYLPGTHGWISWSRLNVCMSVYACMLVCANQLLFSFKCSSMGMSVPE